MVTDALILAGSIVERGHIFYAFNIKGDLVGKFHSQIAAMRAIPAKIERVRRVHRL
jgi:hypothetical protein